MSADTVDPKDPKTPASKPQGTLADQIANMEHEGQAQDAAEPTDHDATAAPPAAQQPADREMIERPLERIEGLTDNKAGG